MKRRRLLRSLGTAAAAGLAGCNTGVGTDTRTSTSDGTDPPTRKPTETDTPTAEPTDAPEEWEVDPLEHDHLVGAFYYPWYRGEWGYMGGGDGPGWLQHTPGTPVLGEYNSRNEAVVNQHVTWALEHGIDWFIVNWGGPGGFEDETIRDHLLEAELGSEISFSLLTGIDAAYRQGDHNLYSFDVTENRDQLKRELVYMSENYFDEPNYLHVDGRPVVYYYGAYLAAGDVAGAFEEARSAIPEDPYTVADLFVWEQPAETGRLMDAFDAVLDYSTYNHELGPDVFEDFAAEVEQRYRTWWLACRDYDVDFVPTTIPGYDDRELRPDEGNPVLPRSKPAFDRRNAVASRYTDPDLDAVVVTTFNEWPEFTPVEPGESYGDRYLRSVAETLVPGIDANASPVADFVPLTIDFAETTEKSPDVPGAVSDDVALQFWRLRLEDGSEEVASYNVGVDGEEPLFSVGAYEPVVYDGDPETSARNLGGTNGEARMYFPPERARVASSATLWGKPWIPGVAADVYFDGVRTDSVEFTGENPGPLQEYRVSLRG